ncbi:MAG: S8 family serine peptidase [Arenimonas sp.]|nr:S8 family serine peptidase [Arenimonas sp.]MBP7981800.1 S8 family serine peptidase [Arenimonas sp.]
MIRLSILAAATIMALGASSVADAGGRPDLVKQDLQRGKQYAAGQMIIQYRSFATDKDKQRVQKVLGGNRAEVLGARGGRMNLRGDLELVQFAAGTSMQSKLDTILNDPAVDFAEPNWLVRHMAVSNDTYFTNGTLWGMYGSATTPANQYGSGAGSAWANGADCSSVVVGIIDEGYMYTHPDLAANAYKNPGEIAGNGRDDDTNGLVDDVYGWDFANNDNTVFDGAGDDHGTHVGGTIGGVGGNGVGVAGVCWSVKLMSAKFLGNRGGTTANAIKAVDYFTGLKNKGMNIVATNNSWGGGGFSQGLADAIERSNTAGILFIAAAGNDGTNNDTTPSYPSGYASANIIAVAALQSDGALAYYSQYGATTVDIGAPGSAVMSTVPVSSKGKVIPGYSSYSGTSMATPHVTGAAALYKARNPGATAAQIKAALLNGTSTPSLQGKVATGDRLDISTW